MLFCYCWQRRQVDIPFFSQWHAFLILLTKTTNWHSLFSLFLKSYQQFMADSKSWHGKHRDVVISPHVWKTSRCHHQIQPHERKWDRHNGAREKPHLQQSHFTRHERHQTCKFSNVIFSMNVVFYHQYGFKMIVKFLECQRFSILFPGSQ